MTNLNKLMEDYKKINRYEERKKLVEKWASTGLLRGLKKDVEKTNMAQLLENQAVQLVEETKTQTAGRQEGWSNIALPLVRRTFGKIYSQELMSVQPMSLPSGLVFYLDFQYGTNKPTNTSIYTSGDSIYGDTTSSADVSGAVYDFRHTYSRNYISASNVSCTMTSASLADVWYDETLSASLSVLKKVSVAKSALSNVNSDTVNSVVLTDSAVAGQYPDYATKDATNLYFIISGSHDTTLSKVEYLRATTQDYRGDFEPGQTGVGAVSEINMKLTSKGVVADTRKVKAIWTQEVSQDMYAYQAVDAEAELTAVMSDQVAREIDMENIQLLFDNARLTDWWSVKVGEYLNDSTGAAISGGSFYGTEMDWYQTLIKKMTKMSNAIYKRTLRGEANWAVVGTNLATIIESLEKGFVKYEGDQKYTMGVERIGTLQSKWIVYKNAYFRDDAVLMGYSGQAFLETGAAYCPYIPLMASPTVVDPDDFTPRKMFMTRAARTMIRSDYYGIIKIRHTELI